MSTLSPENRQKRLDELYDFGKSKGTLTYKEIMDRVMELELDSDQLDHVLETLEAYGVTVVNDSSDETVSISDDQAADVAAATAAADESANDPIDLSIRAFTRQRHDHGIIRAGGCFRRSILDHKLKF